MADAIIRVIRPIDRQGVQALDTPSAADADRRVSVADLMRREGFDPGPELEWNSPSDSDPPTRPIPSGRTRRGMIALSAAVAGSAMAAVLVIATTGPQTTATTAGGSGPAAPPVPGTTAAPPTTPAPAGAVAAPESVGEKDEPATVRAAVIDPETTGASDAQQGDTPPAPTTTVEPSDGSEDADSADQDADRGNNGNGNGTNRSGGNGRTDRTPPGLADGLTDTVGDVIGG